MQHAEVAREKLFTMRMSNDEWARFEAVAAHYSLNVASVMRMLAKREADALGLTPSAKPAKKKHTK